MIDKEAREIWELIIKFAGYGFNKSHSTAYALIAYQTAYLKAHYPVEFMAALLSGDIPGRNFKRKDALVEHLEDCQRMSIEVVPPDVNRSFVDFAVRDGKILFGLSAVKSCGGAAAEAIVKARENGQPFRDLFEFCERVDPSACGRSTIETLVKAGAFDSTGARRAQNMAVLERAMQAGAAALADRRSGQKSLFGMTDDADDQDLPADLPSVDEFVERERLLMEKEVLGFYLSSHPLAEYETKLRTYCSHTTDNLSGLADKTEVLMGGMLSAIKLANVKNARQGAPTKYANFDLEDMEGSIRCILWPDDYEVFGELVKPDAILVAHGSLDRRGGGDEVNLIVSELIPLEDLETRYTTGVVIRVDELAHGSDRLAKVREVVRGYPGRCELHLLLQLENGSRVHMQSQQAGVEVTLELRERIDDLLGAGNLRLLTRSKSRKHAEPRASRKSPARLG